MFPEEATGKTPKITFGVGVILTDFDSLRFYRGPRIDSFSGEYDIHMEQVLER